MIDVNNINVREEIEANMKHKIIWIYQLARIES